MALSNGIRKRNLKLKVSDLNLCPGGASKKAQKCSKLKETYTFIFIKRFTQCTSANAGVTVWPVVLLDFPRDLVDVFSLFDQIGHEDFEDFNPLDHVDKEKKNKRSRGVRIALRRPRLSKWISDTRARTWSKERRSTPFLTKICSSLPKRPISAGHHLSSA